MYKIIGIVVTPYDFTDKTGKHLVGSTYHVYSAEDEYSGNGVCYGNSVLDLKMSESVFRSILSSNGISDPQKLLGSKFVRDGVLYNQWGKLRDIRLMK